MDKQANVIVDRTFLSSGKIWKVSYPTSSLRMPSFVILDFKVDGGKI